MPNPPPADKFENSSVKEGSRKFLPKRLALPSFTLTKKSFSVKEETAGAR
jgi:hypothetical protein